MFYEGLGVYSAPPRWLPERRRTYCSSGHGGAGHVGGGHGGAGHVEGGNGPGKTPRGVESYRRADRGRGFGYRSESRTPHDPSRVGVRVRELVGLFKRVA